MVTNHATDYESMISDGSLMLYDSKEFIPEMPCLTTEDFMVYRVIKTTNRWNFRGDAVDVQDHFVAERETMIEAFKVCAGHKDPVEPVSVKFRVEDETGNRIILEDAYRQEVGEDAFRANLSDETFTINLEHWLARH